MLEIRLQAVKKNNQGLEGPAKLSCRDASLSGRGPEKVAHPHQGLEERTGWERGLGHAQHLNTCSGYGAMGSPTSHWLTGGSAFR